MRLEQLLVTNGYTKEDMIIVSLPTAEQVSVIISSASLLAETNQEHQANERRLSEGRKISTSSIDKKVSFDCGISIQEEEKVVEPIAEATNNQSAESNDSDVDVVNP